MTLQIGDAVGDGLRRAFTTSGGILMAATFAYMLVFLSAVNAVFLEYLPPEAQESGQLGFALPVPPTAAAAIAAISMLVGIALYIIVARALSRDQTDLNTFPSSLVTRRIGRATLSSIGATIILQIAVTIGFILLIIPGIFLAISFMFVIFAIAVEDERAIDALSRSWELASGNRWKLLALLLIVGVIGIIIGFVGSIASLVSPLIGELINLALTTVLMVVIYGIVADAYLQLCDDEDPPETGETPIQDTATTA